MRHAFVGFFCIFISLQLNEIANAAAPGLLPDSLLISDNQELSARLKPALMSLSNWIEDLNQKPFQFLCLGEVHADRPRELVAQVLDGLNFDQLLVEATEEEARSLQLASKRDERLIPWLGANFAPVLLRATARSTPIVGVEATPEQSISTRRRESRDGHIAANIIAQLDNSKKSVAVYGQEHCAKAYANLSNTVPFYRLLLNHLRPAPDTFVSVRYVSSKLNLAVVAKLALSGIERGVYVIDTSKVSPRDYNYDREFRVLLENADYVVVDQDISLDNSP